MIWLLLVLSCFANWRMSTIITSEEGPFAIFGRFRNWVGVRYTPDGTPYGTGNLSRGILCLWCVSVWVAFPQLALMLYSPALYLALCSPLALSAGAILLDTLINGR